MKYQKKSSKAEKKVHVAPSSNWTKTPPDESRSKERIFSTTEARKQFKLSSEEIKQILGYRRSTGTWGGGNNLTMYLEGDLEAFVAKRNGRGVPSPSK